MGKERLDYYASGEKFFRNGEAIYLNYTKEQPMPHLHAHDFIEIAYVDSGEGIHQIGDAQFNVSRGDLFVINYDVPHEFRSYPEPDKMPLRIYNCVFKAEFIDYSLINCKDFSDLTHHFLFRSLFPDEAQERGDICLVGRESPEIGELYRKMYREYTEKARGYVEILRAYVIELLVMIFRIYESMPRFQDEVHLQRTAIIRKTMTYLKENYREGVTLEELSAMSFLSRNYFCKLFKEATHSTVSEYIQEIRIAKACELLKNTDETVLSIAYQVGYHDIKFFNEVFKKIKGETPGSYRRKGRE